MKKILLTLLLIASVNSLFAQTLPCLIDYRINNGGGSCPDTILVGGAVGGGDTTLTATGTVTLTFSGTVTPNNIPKIGSVFEVLPPVGPLGDTLITDIVFGKGTLNNNGTVTYCYYSGPNNNNNLNGRNREFRFNVFFGNFPACTALSTLPVALVSFSALRNNSNVSIKWTTATESNNLGYEIQRLVGNGNWQPIGFVPSQAAAGNSSSNLSYSFMDLNNTKGVTQYRLLQIDIDKRFKYSEIKSVRGDGQLGKTIIYPNPSSDGKVNIVFEETNVSRDISVSDMSGRIVKQLKGVTNNNITIENLAPGMYSLRIVTQSTGDQTVEKIVVNKK